MLRIHIHVQGDVGNSKRPAKSSVTPDLLCMGEPKRPKAQTNVSDTRARTQRCKKPNRIHPKNALVMSVMLSLSPRGAEPCTHKPLRLKGQINALDVCTHVQRVVNNSRRPANTSDMVRKPQMTRRNQTHLVQAQNRPKSSHSEAMCMHAPSTQINTKMTAKIAEEAVSKTVKKPKLAKSPIGPEIGCRREVNGSIMCRDTQSDEEDLKTVEFTSKKSSKAKNDELTYRMRSRNSQAS